MSANATPTSAKQRKFSLKNAPTNWRTLPSASYVVIDTEARGLEARFDRDVTVYCGVAIVQHETGKPKIHKFRRWQDMVDFLQPLLDVGYAIVCHNAKYDLPLLRCRGLRVLWHQVYCTQVLSYLERNDRDSYSLDALTGAKQDLIATLVNDGIIDQPRSTSEFWECDWTRSSVVMDYIEDYCVQDTKACHKLYLRLLKNTPETACVAYHRTEQPMLKVLVQMEYKGAFVDRELLKNTIVSLRQEVESYHLQIRERFGLLPQLSWDESKGEFVPKAKTYTKGFYRNSCTLLSDYYTVGGLTLYEWGGFSKTGEAIMHKSLPEEKLTVYDHCKLTPFNSAAATGHTWWLIREYCPDALEFVGKTKAGKPQVNKEFISDVAEHLPEDFPIAKLAFATKRLQMAESLWKNMGEDDRIRPDFAHTRTLTGRLATSNPNLQNIPRAGDTEESKVFRQLFGAPRGKRIAVADLDQIELRVLAYYLKKVCGDTALAQEFDKPDADPHTANATKWGVKRVVAKTLIFLLIYGGQPALMVKRKLFSTKAEAEAAFESVHKTQPAIKQLMEIIVESCREKGYITTIGGRRLYYPNIRSSRKFERLRAERQCFNALIQGSARDIMHALAEETCEVLADYGMVNACTVNLVHDELVVEVSCGLEEALVADLNLVWQNRLDLLPGVRVNGDWHFGSSWYEAK